MTARQIFREEEQRRKDDTDAAVRPKQDDGGTVESPAERVSLGGEDRRIEIPRSATEEEVAAIVAAISTYLSNERREAESEDSNANVSSWQMAGRYRTVAGRSAKTPSNLTGLPGWKLSARASRFPR